MTVTPGTDTAMMLGLVHTLVSEGLHDQAFLDRYTRRAHAIDSRLFSLPGVPAERRGDVTPLVQAAETRWLRELAVEGGTIDLRPLAHTTGLSSLRTLTLRRTGPIG